MSEVELREKAFMLAINACEKNYDQQGRALFEVAEDIYKFLAFGTQPVKKDA